MLDIGKISEMGWYSAGSVRTPVFFRVDRLDSVKREKIMPPMEVDLHIHQLTESTRGLTNHDMLTLQLDTAKRQLEFAIGKRIQRVVFIHPVDPVGR